MGTLEELSGRGFPPTRLSAVVRSRSPDAAERRAGLDVLARAYWKPVYKYVRLRWRATPEDAEDLTQGFFARALDTGFVERFDAARGRFRAYLRLGLDGFVQNERKAASRLKRGGGERVLSLDFASAESELAHVALRDGEDLERFFQREWVRSLFELAVQRLEAELAAAGKHADFELFRRYDLEDTAAGAGPRITYEALARELSVPVTTVTNRLGAARRAFRRSVLECLAEVTATEEERRDEARALLGGAPE